MNKRIVIFANLTKPEVVPVLDEMKDFFFSCGSAVEVIGLKSSNEDLSLSVPDADLAVSLGGDGTVLTCAFLLRDKQIPLIPVKVGTFGFITDTQASEYKEVYDSWCRGEAKVQKRMMLDVWVERDGCKVFEASVLNEVALAAVSRAKTARFTLYIDDVCASDMRGDGLIVATATGSTAYSLAAGGPVIDSTLNGIIINPISPFTMSIRPLVVENTRKIRIFIPGTGADLAVTADGHLGFDLTENDLIFIEKSRHCTLLVENSKRNFIEVLRDKLGWADGPN